MTTLTDVLAFIRTATPDDLEAMHTGMKRRERAARDERAAAVTTDAHVTLDGLSPKYLNGLTGTVALIQGKRATVRLDKESTDRLRAIGGTRFFVHPGEAHYHLSGVPLSTLTVVQP